MRHREIIETSEMRTPLKRVFISRPDEYTRELAGLDTSGKRVSIEKWHRSADESIANGRKKAIEQGVDPKWYLAT